MPENETTETTTKATEVFVDDKRLSFTTDDATGAKILAAAGVPPDYSLFLRAEGSNEPIAPTETVELKNGEHFFTRPPSNIS
jgi:hypothetical protein